MRSETSMGPVGEMTICLGTAASRPLFVIVEKTEFTPHRIVPVGGTSLFLLPAERDGG